MYSSRSKNQRSLIINSDEIKQPQVIESTNRNRINGRTDSSSACMNCQNQTNRIPARLVLYFLSWSGFLVSFMMRNDINFALIAMTRSGEDTNKTAHSTNNSSKENVSRIDGDIVLYEYDWSSTVQSVILSSFYWWYVLSQVVGGIATQYLGTKQVFGWSQFTTAACSLCIPWAADLHYGCVIVLRSLQGFASGLTWPAMYAIVGPWIPFVERSRFMSSFQGFSIGIGLTYPLCGYIVENHGWRYVFLTTGSLGMLWCVAWFFLAFNTPQQHPRISPQELQYIEENVNAEKNEVNSKRVPWLAIFTSLPSWAIAITTFGRIWIHYIFIVSGPNFMKNILKFEYKENGFLTGMPFICSYFSSLIFCYIADKMVLRLSLTFVRKVFTALSQVVPGILVLSIGYIDNILIILVLWFVAVILITASYAGAMANIVDIAPNYAGPVLAFCQTIHMSASFLSPLAAGLIVNNSTSIEQWRTFFIVASVVACVTYLMYQFYGTAEVQKWNTNTIESNDNEASSEENQMLQKKKNLPATLNNND